MLIFYHYVLRVSLTLKMTPEHSIFNKISIPKGLVRPANGFVTEGKRTKHAEFGYPATKSISSDARDSSDRFVGV